MTDESRMPFGKYKGKKLEDVPADYLLWFYEQEGAPITQPELCSYIAKNMKALRQEARKREEAREVAIGLIDDYGFDRGWD